ncbi:MAG: pseudouridine synthase [Terriglobia bacterium]
MQKIIAAAGVSSRRKAEELIRQGLVSVNGHTVTELGSKADAAKDHIRVGGKVLKPAWKRLHILLNKPVGFVSTVSDPEGRPTVVSLLNRQGIHARVYPVGRLDYASSGAILMTNDGELASILMSRASAVPRTYHVKVEGTPDAKVLGKLAAGIVLDGRKTAPAIVRCLSELSKPWYEITLVEGRYHQVRRMFERIGHPVVKLKRVRIAFLTSDGLAPGKFRHLTPREVDRLRNWRLAVPGRPQRHESKPHQVDASTLGESHSALSHRKAH